MLSLLSYNGHSSYQKKVSVSYRMYCILKLWKVLDKYFGMYSSATAAPYFKM